jgi:hypothetical protein
MSTQGTDRDKHVDGAGKERRDGTAPRLSYEALVEVGARSLGGFEAESVDLSLDGMRLRTAYLPAPGEKVACRFDGFGGEIVAEGMVAWCKSEARGGEFGVQFTGLGPKAFKLLEQMCAARAGDAPDEPSKPAIDADAAVPGARVRLHIQGLGSPMRARVRDVARGEVLVGSNLEFLRVGRDVELEDLERRASRHARIEHVEVDIDPETNIPQLVVALRYEGPEGLDDSVEGTTAPIAVQKTKLSPVMKPAAVEPLPEPAPETTPEPAVIDKRVARDPELTPSVSARPARAAMTSARPAGTPHPADTEVKPVPRSVAKPARKAAKAAPAPLPSEPEIEPPDSLAGDDEDDIDEDGHPMSRVAAARMGEIARTLGPKLASAGLGARGALGKMMAAVRRKTDERREAREQRGKARAPKRTTAPPPSGALRSDGRRLFRDQQRQERVSEPPPEEIIDEPVKKSDKKRALMGAVIGAVMVVGIYFASAYVRQQGEAQPVAAAAESESSAMPSGAAAPPPAGLVPTANVPLFGATPLSTTEPVPEPADPKALKPNGEPATDPKKDAQKSANLEKEWGFGEVVNPTDFRFKMDGQLEGLTGKESESGFVVTVPGRKSISTAAGVARKDKRIKDVDVVNYPDRTEITFKFKDEVPPFVVRAQGKRVVISLSEIKEDKDKKKEKKKKKDGEEEPEPGEGQL